LDRSSVAIVIPARYKSTRFPGKPLVEIAGKTMIERVYRQACKSCLAGSVLVATDDKRIFETVRNFGGQAIMTAGDHSTGTDRLAEVALSHPEIEIVVNVQGDEPLIDPGNIDAAIRPLLEDSTLPMSTIAARITSREEIESNTVVKVVKDLRGNALYFSRLPLPYYREINGCCPQDHYAHIGLYAYRRDILLKLSALAPTPLEKAEALEQLRALENGICIRVVEVEKRSASVDRPDDIRAVLKALAASESAFVPARSTVTPSSSLAY
jgi:3-deoxy-manno-octulosonate cytidylyltransferase (CMP-KDO synthetase)